MPGRDGTGPFGQGPFTGGGRGRCAGPGRGLGRGGSGRGTGPWPGRQLLFSEWDEFYPETKPESSMSQELEMLKKGMEALSNKIDALADKG